MNTVITEISKKAKESVPKGILAPDLWIQEYNRIFAELIIKECGVALSPMLRDMVSRGQAYNLIKEHFGVEE